MRTSKTLAKIALGVLAMTSLSAAAQQADQPAESQASPAATATARKAKDTLKIVSPDWGATVTRNQSVKVKLAIGKQLDRTSLHVRLNGKDVSKEFESKECNASRCTAVGLLSKANGLREGTNYIAARVEGQHGALAAAKSKFDHVTGKLEDAPLTYVPDTVGFSLTSGGAQPWVTVTTGYLLGDTPPPILGTLSTPVADTTFSTSCSGAYQVVELNRTNPTQLINTSCYSDSASLQSYLHGLASSAQGTELVAVGTNYGFNAASGLNTTDIGGTDYTNSAQNVYPMGYAALGIPGAPAGTAYENYYTSSDTAPVNPFLNGSLLSDGETGNYNFNLGSFAQFEARSNDSSQGSFVTLNNGGTPRTYTPVSGATNGFWLLVVNRNSLQPVDATSTGPCQIGSGGSGCGTFFGTGAGTITAAESAGQALATALGAVTSRQMVFLEAVGQAFQQVNWMAPTLKAQVDNFGGAGYAIETLTSSSASYLLVSHGLNNGKVLNPFSQGVAISASINSAQGQSGFLRGSMTQDAQGLFLPSMTSQENASAISANNNVPSVNYAYPQILAQSATDWPDMSTPGQLAAYHWLSNQFLYRNFNWTGSHASDVRYFYNNFADAIANNAIDLDNSVYSTYAGTQYPFTASDQATVLAELKAELYYVKNAQAYLGSNGIGSIIKDGTNSTLATTIITAANDLTSGQIGAASANITVQNQPFNWVSFITGMIGITGSILGPEFPEAGAAIGALGGSIGALSATPYGPNGELITYPTPPTDENGFDITLGSISDNAANITEGLENSYFNSLTLVMGDPGRLAAVGQNVENTDSGWSVPDSNTMQAATAAVSDGIKRSLFLQAMPQVYQVDTWQNTKSTQPQGVGRLYLEVQDSPLGNIYTYYCTAAYTDSAAWGNWEWDIYSAAQYINVYGGMDLYLIGGTIDFNGYPGAVESFPSQTLLNVLFDNETPTNGDGTRNYAEDGLHLPQVYVEANSNFLVSRPGPSKPPYSYTSDMGLMCQNLGCVSGEITNCIDPASASKPHRHHPHN